MAAAGARRGQQGPRYRRRRPLPALVLLAVLIVLSGLLWSRVFGTTETVEMATRCNRPAPPSTASSPEVPEPPASSEAGRMLPRDALDRKTPAPPQEVKVRVLNGNGEANQASLISQELSNLGFGKGEDPANDPVYSDLNLKCHAQIRFGMAGAEAARTLSLIVPCAQLVRDQRADAGVDLSLGEEFDGIRTTQEAMQVLQQLKSWGRQNDSPQASDVPAVDDALLSKARDVHC